MISKCRKEVAVVRSNNLDNELILLFFLVLGCQILSFRHTYVIRARFAENTPFPHFLKGNIKVFKKAGKVSVNFFALHLIQDSKHTLLTPLQTRHVLFASESLSMALIPRKFLDPSVKICLSHLIFNVMAS